MAHKRGDLPWRRCLPETQQFGQPRSTGSKRGLTTWSTAMRPRSDVCDEKAMGPFLDLRKDSTGSKSN